MKHFAKSSKTYAKVSAEESADKPQHDLRKEVRRPCQSAEAAAFAHAERPADAYHARWSI
jgi:hypothetical protein